jgi:hypothetical protein
MLEYLIYPIVSESVCRDSIGTRSRMALYGLWYKGQDHRALYVQASKVVSDGITYKTQ